MRFLYCVLLSVLLMTSCKQDQDQILYYYSENFALLKLNSINDTIVGSIFWINRKDSTQIRGIKNNNTLKFNSFLNGVDEGYFTYRGFTHKNQFKVIRQEKESENIADTIIFVSILKQDYDSILKQTLAPPKLEVLKKDTIIDNYHFELLVENWNPETYYGNSTLIIKDKNSNNLVQIIKSENFHFNKYLSFGYSDMNFDNIKDLVFFNGTNGGYMSQTFDYYIFNKKERKFLLNEQLSEIAGCLGIEVDTINKRIISYCKSGCCMHMQQAYIFLNDNFVEVKSLEIDQAYKRKIVIKNKINGKWTTQTIPIEGELSKQLSDSLYKSF